MGERRVGPEACALVVAIPTTHAAFLDQAQSGAGDFVPGIVRDRGGDVAAAWTRSYHPFVIEPFTRLAPDVRAQGATVVERGALADFARACERFRVVSLLSHARSIGVSPSAILDLRRLVRGIAEGDSATARCLRAHVCEHGPWVLGREAGWPPDAREHLAEILDAALVASSRSSGFRLTRPGLEIAFPGCFEPAGVVEFFGDMRPVRALIDAVPEGFDGVVDFSMCHSAMIGEPLKRSRPRALVVENAGSATVAQKLLRYALVMRELGRQPERFTDVILRVSKALAR